MSTDLEFRRQLHLPNIRTKPDSQSSDATSSGGDITAIQAPDSGDECLTPTSPATKIPAVLSCPPAPKKPTGRVVSSKRKLCELEFFEIVAREEVESFFRSCFDVNSRDGLKKRCFCT